nr:hypothetical protein [Tanacetum cinerariifolium]
AGSVAGGGAVNGFRVASNAVGAGAVGAIGRPGGSISSCGRGSGVVALLGASAQQHYGSQCYRPYRKRSKKWVHKPSVASSCLQPQITGHGRLAGSSLLARQALRQGRVARAARPWPSARSVERRVQKDTIKRAQWHLAAKRALLASALPLDGEFTVGNRLHGSAGVSCQRSEGERT